MCGKGEFAEQQLVRMAKRVEKKWAGKQDNNYTALIIWWPRSNCKWSDLISIEASS